MFHSAPNGNLSYLKSPIEGEASLNADPVPPYETYIITVNDRNVAANTASPQIAAVSYTCNHQDEVIAHSSRR